MMLRPAPDAVGTTRWAAVVSSLSNVSTVASVIVRPDDPSTRARSSSGTAGEVMAGHVSGAPRRSRVRTAIVVETVTVGLP